MEHLLRIVILIWSGGQGDPLDFSLLIKPVISLYVRGFKSNTFKGSFSLFIQSGNSCFHFFLLSVEVFLKNKWHASLLKPGLTVSSISSTSLQ